MLGTLTSTPMNTPVTSTPTKTPVPSTPTKTPVSPTPTATNVPVDPDVTVTPGPEMPHADALSIWMLNKSANRYENVTKKTVLLDIIAGESLQLGVYDASGKMDPRLITWKSSAAKVAVVSSDGSVNGIKAGNATISAQIVGTKTKLTVKVNVLPKVQPGSLRIEGSDVVAVKKSMKLTFAFDQAVQPKNKKVTWASSNPFVASINNGTVKGLTPGFTTITAYSNEDPSIYDTLDVQVFPDASVQVVINDLSGGTNLIDVGTTGTDHENITYHLSATVRPATAGQTVTWKSSAPKVATVDADGTVTAVAPGKVTITATAGDGSKKTAKVALTVWSSVQPGSLWISGTDVVALKKTAKLTAEFAQAVQPQNKKVIWNSDSPWIASVKNGTVTGVSEGIAKITAVSTEDMNIIAECTIRVGTPAETVYIIGKNVVGLGYGDVELDSVVQPSSASQKVSWKSSSPKIAEVLEIEEGQWVLRPYKTGKVTITATAMDGSRKSGKLVVNIVQGDDAYSTKDEYEAAVLVAAEPEVPGEAVEEITEPEEIAVIAEETAAEEKAGAEPVGEVAEEAAEETTVEPEEAAETVEEDKAEGPAEAEIEVVSIETGALEMTAGEMKQLTYESETPVFYGSDDQTIAAVDAESGLLMAVGEGETSVYAASLDPVEFKAVITVSVKAAEEAEAAETIKETEGEELIESADGEAKEPTEAEEPVETEEVTEPVEETEAVEGEEAAESVEDEAVTEPAEETPEAEPVAEEPEVPAEPETEAEQPEIVITDLAEEDALEGNEAETIAIERKRFELDDELLGSLIFEVEDETIAQLTARTAEELLTDGIELKLLAAGETKLTISREGDEEPLREIRIVVAAAPVIDEAEPEAAPVAEEVPVVEEAQTDEESAADEGAGEAPLYDEPAPVEESEPEPADEPEAEAPAAEVAAAAG